jgi:hypothetical protein
MHSCSCFMMGMVWGGIAVSGGILVLALAICTTRTVFHRTLPCLYSKEQ